VDSGNSTTLMDAVRLSKGGFSRTSAGFAN